MLPEKHENPDGLHRRYSVTFADGSPTDPRACYFVLRLDGLGDDLAHIAACRAAARAYADFVQSREQGVGHLAKIGFDLRRLVDHFDSGMV